MFSLAEDKLCSCVCDSSLLLHMYLNLAIAFSQLKKSDVLALGRKAALGVGIF